MKKSTITLLVLVAAFIFSTVAQGAGPDGALVFKQKCVACHGATATGPRDLTAPTVQKLTDEQLTDFIANGGPSKKPAHAFKAKGLTDADIKAVVTYIRTLKK